MRLPQACFESKIKQAYRRCRYTQSKYVARMYKLDNGGFEIRYKRYNKFGQEKEAYPHEVYGYDDWIPQEV